MKTKERIPNFMTTDNRRKRGTTQSSSRETRESCVTTPNGAMVDKIERQLSFLPSDYNGHSATIENVVAAENIRRALEAVIRNKGAPGIDGISTTEIKGVMQKQWPEIQQAILEGKYCPSPVRRVGIPKPDGSGIRQLGIPTVMDRIIQQALHQELGPIFDPTFSQYSFGFRPNRSAHQAVLQAQAYIHEGCEWVVDIDLEKFFDKVNHDKLMARIARRVKDKKILLLIRRFLQAGVMEEGLFKATDEGTPQVRCRRTMKAAQAA